jgi:hypothetical protein
MNTYDGVYAQFYIFLKLALDDGNGQLHSMTAEPTEKDLPQSKPGCHEDKKNLCP